MINKILLKICGVRLVTSQFGEDLIIDMLTSYKKHGFYVDIGANHPITFNNTCLFYNKGWRGINIEPNPSKKWLFKLFRRKDTNLNVGVGQQKGSMKFHVFRPSTLSTFDTDSAEEYKKIGHTVRKIIDVPITPLKEILSTYASHTEIDFMSIDTEGYDMEVLKSNDWNIFRPHFIILETIEYRRENAGNKLNNTYDAYMDSIGYKKIADTYVNTIYEKTY